jgi:hypothetical protein
MDESEHYYPERKGREGYSTTKRIRDAVSRNINKHKDLDKIISEYTIEDIPEDQISIERYFIKYYRTKYALYTKEKLLKSRKALIEKFIEEFGQPDIFKSDPRLQLEEGLPSYRLTGKYAHHLLDLGDQVLTAINVIDKFLKDPRLKKKWHDKILTEEIEREVDDYRARRRKR